MTLRRRRGCAECGRQARLPCAGGSGKELLLFRLAPPLHFHNQLGTGQLDTGTQLVVNRSRSDHESWVDVSRYSQRFKGDNVNLPHPDTVVSERTRVVSDLKRQPSLAGGGEHLVSSRVLTPAVLTFRKQQARVKVF